MESKTEPRTRVITLEISLLEMRIEVVRVDNNKKEKNMEEKDRTVEDIHGVKEGK